MDFKRAILYASLVIVAYFIVLQWNEDYHTKKIDNKNSAILLDETKTNVNSSQTNQTNLNKEENINQDLVFAPQENSSLNNSTNIKNLDTTIDNKNFIKVKTQNFDLEIDLNGGDLISAKLPKYKEELKSDNKFQLLDNQKFYYVVQSELQGIVKNRIKYKAKNINYDFSNSNEQENQIILEAEENNVFIRKIFVFAKDSYLIKVKYEVQNNSENNLVTNFLGLIKRDNSVDPSQAQGVGVSAFLGVAYSTQDKKYEKIKFKEIEKNKINETSNKGWIAIIQHYFISSWIFDTNTQNQITTAKDKKGNNVIGFLSSPIEIAKNSSTSLENKIYLGPKIQKDLSAAAENLDLSVDFGWLWFISQPLFWILNFIESFVGNWGIAIILLTLLIKILFFKLSATSYKSMAKMKNVAPKLQKIKDQYGDDKQKQSQAMMELYRKEKINPMGGCLPILVQMPVFIALYWMLMESIELRQAPFYFWIEDLSIKDPYFILPILMGATMFIQQLLNPPPPDPMQARIMKLLPVIFTVFFLWFPAGLVLYWLINNLLSILQQWLITKNIEKESKKN